MPLWGRGLGRRSFCAILAGFAALGKGAVGIGQPVEQGRDVLDLVSHHMYHAGGALHPSRHPQETPGDDRPAKALKEPAPDNDIDHAAVPGRCRRMTRPATVTRAPSGGSSRRAAISAAGGRGQAPAGGAR